MKTARVTEIENKFARKTKDIIETWGSFYPFVESFAWFIRSSIFLGRSRKCNTTWVDKWNAKVDLDIEVDQLLCSVQCVMFSDVASSVNKWHGAENASEFSIMRPWHSTTQGSLFALAFRNRFANMKRAIVSFVSLLLKCSTSLATLPLALHQLVEVGESDEVVLSLHGHDVDGDEVRKKWTWQITKPI